MNIKFTGKIRGLTDFEWNEIPSLAVLTGVNGAGKSQVLNLIRENCTNGVVSSKNPKVFTRGNNKIQFSNIDIEKKGILYWGPNGNYINIENNKFGYQDLKFIITFLKNEIDNCKIDNEQLLEYHENDDHSLGKNRLKNVLNQKKEKIIESIEQQSSKSRHELNAAELSYYFPEDILLEDFDLFTQDSLEFIFFMYVYKKQASSRYNLKLLQNDNAPWDILNEVFDKANLPYQITKPSSSLVIPIFENALNDIHSERFNVQLIEPSTREEIGFQNLSSGERIIASLALLIYYTKYRGQRKNLLILDEPDAHLHPSLTKQFFDVINDVIINKYNGRVIMATHSASTVALAPEDSIFAMYKTGTRIQKSTKDKALKILTSGVPSFSINYVNRRQIFVESPYDVIFFEKFYRFLSDSLHPEISLSFISSGESRTNKYGIKISNCEQVENITNTLRESGNKFIWGIIDWDLKENTGNEYVKILGNKNRYSIENYIFDPLLVGALLLRQKLIDKNEVGLEQDDTFIDLRTFQSSKLQKISDFIISKLENKITNTIKGEQSCELINGKSIVIPNWYLHHNGHQLENKIIETFPELNDIKKKKEEALKVEILTKIVEDLPGLISVDILEVFKSVQE